MADTKISSLPISTTPLAGTEVIPVVQSGTTKQVSVDNLTAGKVVSASSFTSTATGTVFSSSVSNTSAYQTGVIENTASEGYSRFRLLARTGGSGSELGFYYAPGSFARIYCDGPDPVDIYAGGAKAASFTTDLNLSLPSGNLVIGTSGKGIDFSADGSAAGMTSELLDDYEEGTWTPAFSSTDATFTYSFQQGYYTKIGRQVFVHAFIRGQSAGTLSNAIYITGLPFSQSAATSAYGSVTFGQINRVDYPAGVSAITGFIQGGETQIRLLTATDDANAGSLTAEAFDGTTTAGFILSASYFAA